jgi:hypothetical protein
MEVLLKIKNATPNNIKSKLNKALKRLGTDFRIARSISHTTNTDQKQVTVKLNKALKRLGTDFHIEKCTKIRKSEKGRKLQGRINFQGLNISIENRKGSIRYGIDSDGHSWKTKMNYPYGRIIGVQRLGHDGDHIDCYVGDNRQSDKVYIIHIKNCITGTICKGSKKRHNAQRNELFRYVSKAIKQYRAYESGRQDPETTLWFQLHNA